MKHLNKIAAFSFLALAFGTTLIGCSSDNDPATDPATESSQIGVSDPVLYFDAGGSEGEITTESNGWTLSEVVMTESDGVYDDFVILQATGTVYDSQFYQPELKADKPFEYTVNKMTFSYSDKKIKIKADSRDSDHEYLYEFILKKGDKTETVYCHHTGTFNNPPAIVATPSNLTIPAEGGVYTINITLNHGFKGWSLDQIDAYGYGHNPNNLGVSVNPGDTWSQDFLWFSLEADGPENLRITVQTNVHKDVRDFQFDLTVKSNRVRITGTQAAE